MLDELERLRHIKELDLLLFHYASLGKADRDAWHDRTPEQQGAEARELVKLHGELLAYGWIEQNTGATPALRPGAPCCYRVTTAGVRALKQAREVETEVARVGPAEP
jgi:hypothetical protein